MSGAEIVGLAASVVQLADVGLRLSVNLYTYTRKVKSADKSIEALSNEIATTGAILRQLGAQFDDEHTRQLCKPQAIDTAKGLVADCEKVFAKLQKLADPLEPAKRSKVGILQRVKYTFLETHIDELKANLDRLKSSLLVILNLLILAEQVRNKETPQILGEQKQLLQSLVAETAVNEQRYHAIVKLLKQAEHSDASSDTTLVAPPFQNLIAKTDSLPQTVSSEFNLPDSLKHHCGRIVDHGRLVTNLLGQVSSQEYKLDHAHRLGLHNGILDIHWNAWSHMRKAHGHHVFLKLFGGFEDVARHWSDKVLLNTQLEMENINPEDSTQRDTIGNGISGNKNHLSYRSRTGCWACRARRLKCNEARPTCERCATKGLTCEYTPRSAFHYTNKIPKVADVPSEALKEREANGQAQETGDEDHDSRVNATMNLFETYDNRIIQQDKVLQLHSRNRDKLGDPVDDVLHRLPSKKDPRPTQISHLDLLSGMNSNDQLRPPKRGSKNSNLTHVPQHSERHAESQPHDEHSARSTHTEAPRSTNSASISKEAQHASTKKPPLPMEYHRIGFARKYDKKRGRVVEDTETVTPSEDSLAMSTEQLKPDDKVPNDPSSDVSTQQQEVLSSDLRPEPPLLGASSEAFYHNEVDELHSTMNHDECEGKDSTQSKIADHVLDIPREESTPQKSSGTVAARRPVARSGSGTVLVPCGYYNFIEKPRPQPKQSSRSVRRVGNFHAGSDPSKPHGQDDSPMEEAEDNFALIAEGQVRNQDVELKLQRDDDGVQGTRAHLTTSTGTTPSRYTISGPSFIDSIGEPVQADKEEAGKKKPERNQSSTWTFASTGQKRKSHKSGSRQKVVEKSMNDKADQRDSPTEKITDQFQDDLKWFMGTSQNLGSSSYFTNPMNAGPETDPERIGKVPALSLSNYCRGDTPPPWYNPISRDFENNQVPSRGETRTQVESSAQQSNNAGLYDDTNVEKQVVQPYKDGVRDGLRPKTLEHKATARQERDRRNRRLSPSIASSSPVLDKATIRTPTMVMAERKAREARRAEQDIRQSNVTEAYEIVQPNEPVRVRRRDSDVRVSNKHTGMKDRAKGIFRAAEGATQHYSLAEVRLQNPQAKLADMTADKVRYEESQEVVLDSSELEQKQESGSRRPQLENMTEPVARVKANRRDFNETSPTQNLSWPQSARASDERLPSSFHSHSDPESFGNHEIGGNEQQTEFPAEERRQSDKYHIRSYSGLYSTDISRALLSAQKAARAQKSFSRTPVSSLSLDPDLGDTTGLTDDSTGFQTSGVDPKVFKSPQPLDTEESKSPVTLQSTFAFDKFDELKLEISKLEPVAYELQHVGLSLGSQEDRKLEAGRKDTTIKNPNLSDDDEIKGLQEEAKKDDNLDQWLIADRRSSYGGSDNDPDHVEGDWSHNTDQDDDFLVAELTFALGADERSEEDDPHELDRAGHVEFDIERQQDEAQKDQKLEARLQSLGAFGEDIGQLLLQFSTLSPAEVDEIA